MYHYVKRYGEFMLVDNKTGREIWSHGEKVLGVTVSLVEDGRFYLHKHGGYSWVETWFNVSKAKYLEQAKTSHVDKLILTEMANNLRLYRVENCLLEDLNKILDTSALPIKYLDFLQPINLGESGISDQLKNIIDIPSKGKVLSRDDIRSAIREGADREIIRQDDINLVENA